MSSCINFACSFSNICYMYNIINTKRIELNRMIKIIELILDRVVEKKLPLGKFKNTYKEERNEKKKA